MTVTRRSARSRRASDATRREAVDRVLPSLLVSSWPSKVNVWRSYDGRVVAFGYAANGQDWFHLPGVASYLFGADGSSVTAMPHSPVSRDRVCDAYTRTVLPLVLQVRGWEIVHASAVWSKAGVVAFLAASETGKSTLAHALAQRGRPVWADDAVAFEMTSRGAVAVPLPFQVRLRHDAWAFLGPRPAPASPTSDDSSTAPLVALFVLTRGARSSRRVRLDRLTAARAFRAVLEHAYCFDPSNGRRKRMMLKRYLDLTRGVPVFELRYPAGLENLPAILDQVERALAGLASGDEPAR